jgi:ATP-binding cassette, subfamily A (ABC1), member 3
MLSFVFTVILTAKAIVHEKETGLKEAMKLMGMKTWVYWLSWYIKTFILLLPALIFMCIAYQIKVEVKGGSYASIVNRTDWFIFSFFLFLYASSTITFTFMCTSFFKKANNGAAGAGVIFFFSYLPYIFISLRYEEMSLGLKLILSFVNNIAMSMGVQLIGMFEGKGTGIQFSNWHKGISVDDSFCFLHVISILFINNFIHIFFTWYFENVMPGQHGIAKPWHFPISCFLEDKSSTNTEINMHTFNSKVYLEQNTDHKDRQLEDVFIENEAIYSTRKIGIQISNIIKSFKQLGTIKKAVNNLSLNIYEEHITVLLGHNGAGKSTTISMITGLLKPSAGHILINGKDIVNETEKARSVLGYCPQHNLLFDDLTVDEHLIFFSKLKENYDSLEINNMLDMLNLMDKKHTLARSLSGGMKRKLSVAIAFIGGSKIVILDEPSKLISEIFF